MKGKICIVPYVTGYGGPAAAEALLAEGASVLVNDYSFADEAVRESFAEANPKLEIVSEVEPEKLIAEVIRRHGRVDFILCNNATPLFISAFETAKVDDLGAYLRDLTVNPYRLVRAVVPHMKKQGGGKIVFMTSAGPVKGLPNFAAYCAARGATTALMKSLAREVAAENIQVNAIGPNFAENPTYFPPEIIYADAAKKSMSDIAKKIVEPVPAKRFGTPEEMGGLIAFLASDKSGFITKQLICFAGGWA